MSLRPKYISFDCYGTLLYFEMAPVARKLYADRVPATAMDAFTADFSAYRLDEVLGAWKPYREVVEGALRRLCAKWRTDYRDSDAERVYAAIPSWGPHPDVVAPLQRVGEAYPLVILSNSMNDLIPHAVRALKAPFHAVCTAEEAGAYKPHMRAFEYMLEQLGCGPDEVLHCSSSFRYDHMTADDLGFRMKAFINRGHEPVCSGYHVQEMANLGGLPELVGL
jgi:2-haloacid dehalogenase